MQLSERQKKYLRRLGHALNPVVALGNNGLTDDLIGHRHTVGLTLQIHGYAEHNPTILRQLRDVDDLGIGQPAFDFGDSPFDEALILTRRMVFGVLGQIAVATRFGDGADDGWTVLGLQTLQFSAQTLGATHSDGGTLHERSSLCRSCSRFTSTASK